MNYRNHTTITEFILAGLSEDPELQPFLFAVFFSIYVITVSGNICIILAYNLSSNLHNPMYFILANFAFVEICYVSVISPKMLEMFLADRKTISFYCCAFQLYCTFLFGTTECIILAVMSYDRYNAICRPLLYNTIMNKINCTQFIAGSWFMASVNAFLQTVFTFTLPFCDDNMINSFFCDIPPLLKLACADTWVSELVTYFVGGSLGVGPCILIMVSYIQIILTVLTIHSSSGRKKAFSTCTSHFLVVIIFYGSIFFVYLTPQSSESVYQNRLTSVMYTIIAPLLNPFIYSLRNKDVKIAILKIINQNVACQRK
ncbi:olfactory receptor 5P6-like [Pelobates fuscus]|uniref:olfactory receptor 5P6-like n=1 Tax=Pelobates fuscus TaxID=191477 RepID=UPI002FE47766